MNRTIKEATVKHFHYDSHDQLRAHLEIFVEAYNFARRLKTLKGSRHTSSSAKAGQQSPSASDSSRSIKCWDKTLRLAREMNYALFSSLAFGVRRSSFQAPGGFDEAFVG